MQLRSLVKNKENKHDQVVGVKYCRESRLRGRVDILRRLVTKGLTDEMTLEQKTKGSERTNVQISGAFQLEGVASTNIGKFEAQ